MWHLSTFTRWPMWWHPPSCVSVMAASALRIHRDHLDLAQLVERVVGRHCGDHLGHGAFMHEPWGDLFCPGQSGRGRRWGRISDNVSEGNQVMFKMYTVSKYVDSTVQLCTARNIASDNIHNMNVAFTKCCNCKKTSVCKSPQLFIA